MNKAILSDKYPEYAEKLKELGYDIIPSERVECLIPYEQDHADMQCLIINDTAFVLSCCQKLAKALSDSFNVITCAEDIGGRYPANVALNAALVGKYLVCREASLDENVREYCSQNEIELINVKQGYSKCSCAIVSDNAVITADKGIYRALINKKIDTLLIEQGSINLEGADYGFIGGASGYDRSGNKLFFCGNIKKHPDYYTIKDFCDRNGSEIINLMDGQLTDIGGILFC